MKIVFGTTNKRKIEDLKNVVGRLNLDYEILSLKDIGWDEGEIEENGVSIEENSTIKAMAVHKFCKKKGLPYVVFADDAGLFCEALGGAPGIFTARYADDEFAQNPALPKHQCVLKLLKNLEGEPNRNATYRCAVTCIFEDGTAMLKTASTDGVIANEIVGELKKPYFYSVFVADGTDKAFSDLSEDELLETYRYVALEEMLKQVEKTNQKAEAFEK